MIVAAGETEERFVLDLGPLGGGSCLCTVRRSVRARRLRLIVNGTGLTLVVPMGHPPLREVDALLEPHKAWIVKSLERVHISSVARHAGDVEEAPPKRILLRALGEEWRVVAADSPEERLSAKDGFLRLPQDFRKEEAFAALRRWVLLRARRALPPLLMELAMEHGLAVGGVSVKAMRSRWGSCSSKGNISLNSRLLFLPPNLVRHVLLHELCHITEMNHARTFHDRLREMDPEAERHAAELKGGWGLVPRWAR